MNTSTKPLRTLLALACVAGCTGLHAAVTCSFNGVALALPLYDSSNTAPTDSVGSVDVLCTNIDVTSNSGVTVALSVGAGANGSISDRKMAGNGDLLRYGIYSDAGRVINWGQGMEGVQQSSGLLSAGETKPLHFTLFARIPALQNVHAGLYQDQLILTITP